METSRDPRLSKGVDQFNRQLFFECHETLEEIWLEDNSEDRLLYQGVIQIAAGYYKWQQNVLGGAMRLLQSGLDKITAYPPDHLGLDLGKFIEDVKAHLTEIEDAYKNQRKLPNLRPPTLTSRLD